MRPVLENVRTISLSALPDLQTGSRGSSVAFLQELLFIKVMAQIKPKERRKYADLYLLVYKLW